MRAVDPPCFGLRSVRCVPSTNLRLGEIVADQDQIFRVTRIPGMTIQDRAIEAPKSHETTSLPDNLASPKGGKSKKSKEAEEKVPITFSVSADFAKRLKIVVSALDESSGVYVESRLSTIVKRDLKRILEEMA